MSSVYTSKILAEHPVASWPMDDGASYISLITESQRDMTSGWTGTNYTASAGPSIEKPFSNSGVWQVNHSGTGSTVAEESMVIYLSSLYSAADVHPSTSIAASVYVYIELAASVLSIDIGSSGTTGSYTTNYINQAFSNGWVKVESSNLTLADGSIYIRFNLNAGVDREAIIFYVNGLSVGQYSQPHSSKTLGVTGDKIGPYIKGGTVDVRSSLDDFQGLCLQINSIDINTITVPVKVTMASTTSDSVTLDTSTDSYLLAKKIYANFKDYKKIILEPYPWINSGANTPDQMNPATPADWFESWKSAVVAIAQDMPDAYGIYGGTTFELIEDETALWLDLFNSINLNFRGQVLYKTKWWITDAATPSTYTDYEANKLNLGLWAGVDTIAISSFFELTEVDAPSQAQLESALSSTGVGSRSQDVHQEVINFWDTWTKPILLADVGCPALDDGAYQPWNETVSAVPNADIQSNLINAYQSVFGTSDGYVGFCVPRLGTTGSYSLADSAKTAIFDIATAPINNAFFELSHAASEGIGDYDAYYAVTEKRLSAYSTGIPMVYGADGYTRLRSVAGYLEQPAFVFDGQGAFNVVGSNQEYTIEFWLRVHGYCSSDRKIFGPLETPDGLYINGSTMTLVYGESAASANVGIMHHPMLVTIKMYQNKIDLFINGEPAIVMDAERGALPLQNESNKFLGFFCYPDIEPVDIDSITVFAYIQPNPLAKIHFALAQAVDSLELNNSRLRGDTVQPSFSSIQVAKNVSYPNTFNWDAGESYNLDISDDRLQVVNRPLPEIILTDKDEDAFYGDNRVIQDLNDLSFTFRPDATWSSESGFFHFEDLNDFCNQPQAFSFIWSTPTTAAGEETIAVLRSKQDYLEYVRVFRDGAFVKVEYVSNDVAEELQSTAISINNKYVTVVDFNQTDYTTSAPLNMQSLFQNTSDIEVLLGGDGTSTFTGSISRASYYDDYTYISLSALLAGYPTETLDYAAMTAADQATVTKASYSMIAQYKYNTFFADVEQVGYWEDYIPMTIFANAIENFEGEDRVAVDQIQFNIGASRPSIVDTIGITYGDLDYSSLTYQQLVDLLAGEEYQRFTPLADYVGDSLEIRSFISFQNQSSDIKVLSDLTGEFSPNVSNVIKCDVEGLDLDYKMEVFDFTTIVPPQSYRIEDVVVVVHLEFVSRNSITRPISVKTMELASYGFNKNTFTDIGSKTGVNIYPFITNSFYYDHSTINPMRVGKRIYSPLYLGRESGFTPAGQRSSIVERGMLTVIPQAAADLTYELAALQFWISVDDVVPFVGDKIFEFIDGSNKVSFVVDDILDSASLLKISIVDENSQPYTDAAIYQNGARVSSIYISINEWTSIAIYMDDAITFTTSSPKIKIYPGASYMNISYFQPDENIAVSLVARQWQEIDDEYWVYWTYGESFDSGESSWQGILFPGEVLAQASILPTTLFNAYVGRNITEITPQSALQASQSNIVVQKDVLTVTYSQEPS